MYDLKAAQMNIQCSLIWEHVFYEFQLGHNAVEATKNLYCVETEGIFDHSTVTRWFRKFYSGCKNLDDQIK